MLYIYFVLSDEIKQQIKRSFKIFKLYVVVSSSCKKTMMFAVAVIGVNPVTTNEASSVGVEPKSIVTIP